ncbi:MAG: hypothetical protein KAT30_13760, partial [Candidatus Krumholzibacteria bacterium]|nr:hypothetical protein [Candidatus Krumholzibacteria bacterium]
MDTFEPSEEEKISSHGTLKPFHLFLIAAAAIIVAGFVFYYIQTRDARRPAPQDEVAEVPEGSRAVTLYFAHRDEEILVTETRLIAIGKEYADQIEQVIRELLRGPEEDGVSTITGGTQLLDVF